MCNNTSSNRTHSLFLPLLPPAITRWFYYFTGNYLCSFAFFLIQKTFFHWFRPGLSGRKEEWTENIIISLRYFHIVLLHTDIFLYFIKYFEVVRGGSCAFNMLKKWVCCMVRSANLGWSWELLAIQQSGITLIRIKPHFLLNNINICCFFHHHPASPT